MSWILALCAASLAILAYIELEKVKKENKRMGERIAKLEGEVNKK
ncbi:hypothetical protein [Virgibacillus indicus]|nr:hypothetical protein [Virgibacillus indicus]